MYTEKQKQFFAKFQIDQGQSAISETDIDNLNEIESDYISRLPNLKLSAEFFANAVQSIPHVHSVRWRLKDSKHLIRKILRKILAKEKKYQGIDKENYRGIVTDLIGIRAIHLFKEDLYVIDPEIRNNWDTLETPVIYVRAGDPEIGLIDGPHEVRTHHFGYRSAHYIVESKPSKQAVIAELQVRTIFEEGWSEIDHRLRYPDHSNNADLKSILTLFNRIAGSADEIASFTLSLKDSIEITNQRLDELKTEATQAMKERDASFVRLDSILMDLDNQKNQTGEHLTLISQLKSELNSMKENSFSDAPLAKIQSKNVAQPDSNQTAGALLAALAAWAVLSK